jgi:LmbE family N-acetylglucosaminyl deacetylase
VQLVDVAGDQPHPDHDATTTAAGTASFAASHPGSTAIGTSWVTVYGRPSTSELDLLTGANRRRLHDIARWNQPLDVDQANVLLAALVLHNNEYAGQPGPTYGEWREGHLDTERELRVSGLLYADHKPEAAKLHPEVLYSLRCQETPRADGH